MTNTQNMISSDLSAIVEVLADIEHERWSHWQKYMHSKCKKLADGSLVIPPDLVEKWERQAHTKYSDLSNKEKDSDRDQVFRYLSIIDNALNK